MVKSLAGSGREYAEIRGRIRDGVLHIQGNGEEVNRDYGVAVDVAVPQEFADWLGAQGHTLDSLAGTETQYVPMQVANRGSDTHIQVKANIRYNRPYGAAFNVDGEAAVLLDEFIGDGDDEDEGDDDEPTVDGTAVF